MQGKRLKVVNTNDKNKLKAKLKDAFMDKQIKTEPSSDSLSPEQSSFDSTSTSNSSISNSTSRRRLQPIIVARNRVGLGSSKCPFLNQVCAKRRLLETKRSNSYQVNIFVNKLILNFYFSLLRNFNNTC